MADSAFASADRSARDIADINITPLVDVLLVLLIIFMVTAPSLSQALDVRLPQGKSMATNPPARMQLVVQAGGRLRLDGEWLSAQELREALALSARHAPSTVVQITTGEDADYQAFTQALALTKGSGITNIAL